MNKVVLATIGSLLLVIGIVVMNNNDRSIEQANEDLAANPPAARGLIYKVTEDGAVSYSDVAPRQLSQTGTGSTRGLKSKTKKTKSSRDVDTTIASIDTTVQESTSTPTTTSSTIDNTTTTASQETGDPTIQDSTATLTATSSRTGNTNTTASEPVVEVIQVASLVRTTNAESNLSEKIIDTCKVNDIGINTASFIYYSSELPLKNIAKMATAWGAQSELDLDANGYIKSLGSDVARTILTDDIWGRNADDNRYVVLYDGEGELDFMYKGRPKVIKSEPGRIEIELQQEGRVGMMQTSTNSANYLRNIRIVPIANEEDYDKTITRKKYRDLWSGVGVVRYLDAQRTNHSTEVEWNDRQKRTTFGAKKGESLEDIIQSSNEMNTSPWLLVPHLANDNYFRQMAIYVRDHLNPNLKVHIEYTNEAWNFGFAQAQYLYQLSQKNGTSRHYEYGMRAKKIFDVWSDVFGGNERLVRVIGTQLYYPWISEQIMKTPGLAGSTDALAVGYYIGNEFSKAEMSDKIVNMTDDEVFNHFKTVSFPKAQKSLTEQKQIADQFNVKLIAYEAGQHLVAGKNSKENTTVVNRFIELNRSPIMYQLYMDMFKQWNDVGGDLIVWFQSTGGPSKYGSWGLLDNTSQDPLTAPKFRAFKEMLIESGCIS